MPAVPVRAQLGTAAGGELLAELGFLHVPGPPMDVAPAYLFVALRRRPTLRHYDPERVEYWVTEGGRGHQATVDWLTRTPRESDFSWGNLRVVDRLGVANEWATFGGTLATGRSGDTRVLVFTSDAPILARAGHSQEGDPLANAIAAWFARVRAAAGSQAGVEQRFAGLTEVARYAAFIAAATNLSRAKERRTGWPVPMLAMLRGEQRRLERTAPADWAAGAAFSGAGIDW
jgi:hypothetical protein